MCQVKKVTYEQFMLFKPCYGAKRVKEIAGRKKNWTALDVLRLDKVPAEDRLWAVLREEFIDVPILHEFACRCAEDALKLVDKPDPRSIAAIAAKRAWLRGEVSDDELHAAWVAARAAASAAASAADSAAAWAAASAAAWAAASAAARAAARDNQIKLLIDMLEATANSLCSNGVTAVDWKAHTKAEEANEFIQHDTRR
jgi:hypothetical protein